MSVNNPFIAPKKVDRVRDDTMGRGYVDDGQPTRLTRIVDRVMVKITQRLNAAYKFARDNEGFDKVPIDASEKLDILQGMEMPEIEALIGVHGREAIAPILAEWQIVKAVNGER